MTFNRTKLFWTFAFFLFMTFLLQISSNKSSLSTEYEIFNLKTALILFAVYLSTDDTKEEKD